MGICSNQGSSIWQAPSNIAIVKYWGKYGRQMPCNPSISFTLKNSVTRTLLKWSPREDGPQLDFLFEGKKSVLFESKIQKYLNTISLEVPSLHNLKLEIESCNTFPHSAGIASSASSMGALALALSSMSDENEGKEFFKKASILARLGSGSACRSIYGGVVCWEDDYAIPLEGAHEIFLNFRDAILIVDSSEKKKSSSLGHALMEDHPYRDARFQRARDNYIEVKKAIIEGDINTFIRIAEEEALTLHSLMMTSNPSFILLKANSLEIIEKVRKFRERTGTLLCFTIDAGPNIHLLYPKKSERAVESFIESELVNLLENGKWISDEVGPGPKTLARLNR